MNLVTCKKCGQIQALSENGTCIKCGAKIEPPSEKGEVKSAKVNGKHQSDKFPYWAIWLVVIFAIAVFGWKYLINSNDGSKCYICGKDAVYTTSSGYGFCGKHLIEALDYDKK